MSYEEIIEAVDALSAGEAKRLQDHLAERFERASFLEHVEAGRQSARDEPTIPLDEAMRASRKRLEDAIKERHGENTTIATS